MKKFICALLAAVTVIGVGVMGGCGLIHSGVDGKDGQDLNIYDIYEATNEERAKNGLSQLDFLEFLREYLHYDFEYSDDSNLQSVMNRSLLSAVSLVTSFSYGYQTAAHAGSGVIVDIDKTAGDAYIVTNAHVVYDSGARPYQASKIYAYFYGNDDIYNSTPITDIQLVNYSLTYDIALLKVTGSDYIKNSDARAAVFAESEEVYAGEKVFTVGNPGGFGLSVTLGIISRESETISLDFTDEVDGSIKYRVMRTDAGSNGGNSGGALYDTSGRIVGIINSKDGDAENENMNYALCGSYVKRLWKLMRDNPVTHNRYGVNRAVFPTEYTYTSSAVYNNATNRAEITDTVTVVRDSLFNGKFDGGDKIVNIKIVDGSGKTVENLPITRHFNVDDVLISARTGYSITYTVERDGDLEQITANPYFKFFI